MSNYINYLGHITTTPDYYQRNYEHDIPTQEDSPNWLVKAQKTVSTIAPFFSLHQSLNLPVSIVMGSIRIISNLGGSIASLIQGEWKTAAFQMFQAAVAVLSLAATVLQFTVGMIISTCADLILSMIHLVQDLIAGNYNKALEEFLQVLSSALYLAMIFTGQLELTLVSLLVQALISLYQASDEFKQGNFLEGILKIILAAVRGYQAGTTVIAIQRRNVVFQEFEELLDRVNRGKEVEHLIDTPITNATIRDGKVILSDANGKEYDFGSHFHGFGKELVKEDNLCFRTKVINGKQVTELDFKINHIFREKLQEMIEDFKSNQGDSLKEFLSAARSHVKNIKVETVNNDTLGQKTMGSAYKITFEGVGSVFVGASRDVPNLFDRVVVRLDAGNNMYNLHEMLSFMDLDNTLRVSSVDDIEKIKIGRLFRTFFPYAATPLERSEKYFSLSTESLKEEMIRQVPEMKAIFEEYLPHMEAREIFPGRVRYSIKGLAEKAYELGARALTAAVTGAYSDAALFERVASMIKMGMLSTNIRYGGLLNVSGMSSSYDFYTGADDSVFMQMFTEKDIENSMPFSNLFYNGKIRLILSLDVLETGTYQYHYDSYGTRKMNGSFSSYAGRPGIEDFITEQAHNSNYGYSPGHEVMAKERIPPSMITGIVVQNNHIKENFISYLNSHNLIQNGTVLGKPIDEFIRVGYHVTEANIS